MCTLCVSVCVYVYIPHHVFQLTFYQTLVWKLKVYTSFHLFLLPCNAEHVILLLHNMLTI